MDSEVTNLAAVKAFNPAAYATAAQGSLADSALQSVTELTQTQVEDDASTMFGQVSGQRLAQAMAAALSSLSTSRAGEVAWYAVNTAPTGTLKANGAAVSRTTYAALFAVIGTTFGAGNGSTTFNVPDMRGEFARGWDDGRGVDSGRAFGSAQADEFKAHVHSQIYYRSGSTDSTGSNPHARDFQTTNTGSTGGSETRPRNIALLAVIFF